MEKNHKRILNDSCVKRERMSHQNAFHSFIKTKKNNIR